jgi:DNA-binding response OmpR family regulator
MVVDDDPAIRRLVELRFQLDDFDVFSTGEPEEAVRLAASERPDALVLDVMMPGMDGFEVCRRVRTADDGDNRPVVVMLSARDSRESMNTGLAAGADDYLLKPADLDELVDRVSKRLRQRSSRRAG